MKLIAQVMLHPICVLSHLLCTCKHCNRSGRIQPVSLGGEISVIFSSQVSVGNQVSFRNVQNRGEKSYFCRF